MKTRFTTPGFEFMFAAGIVICLILPPVVMAQNHQELRVTINNGDTTANGKSMKDLSPTERKTTLQSINDVNKDATPGNIGMLAHAGRRDNLSGTNIRIVYNDDTTHKGPPQHRNGMGRLGRMHGMQGGDPGGMQHGPGGIQGGPGGDMQGYNRHFRYNGKHSGDWREHGFNDGRGHTAPGRRNSARFSYSTTNNDGISTRINYDVNDVNKETLKKISGADAADLSVNDLLLTPSFSTGKTMLTFALTDKGSAEVTFKDSEGKTLWTEKASGTLSKSFELPMNGIYYLQVKQNNKVTVRSILKQE